jgi:DNA-binding transcriptional ArsR family regulator
MNATMLIALAEPNRLRIVELLRDGPRPVGEIAEKLGLGQPQASKHLRVLRAAGIVEVRPVAQQRVYQLQAQSFQELDTWVDTFRKVWENRLDTLDAYLQELKKSQPKHGENKQE